MLATRFGGKAVELVQRGEFGTMVAYAPPDIVALRLEEIVGKTKTVPLDHDLLLTAKAREKSRCRAAIACFSCAEARPAARACRRSRRRR